MINFSEIVDASKFPNLKTAATMQDNPWDELFKGKTTLQNTIDQPLIYDNKQFGGIFTFPSGKQLPFENIPTEKAPQFVADVLKEYEPKAIKRAIVNKYIDENAAKLKVKTGADIDMLKAAAKEKDEALQEKEEAIKGKKGKELQDAQKEKLAAQKEKDAASKAAGDALTARTKFVTAYTTTPPAAIAKNMEAATTFDKLKAEEKNGATKAMLDIIKTDPRALTIPTNKVLEAAAAANNNNDPDTALKYARVLGALLENRQAAIGKLNKNADKPIIELKEKITELKEKTNKLIESLGGNNTGAELPMAALPQQKRKDAGRESPIAF